MLSAALLYACATADHVQAPPSQFTATSSPTSLVYEPPPTIEWPTPEPAPTPSPEPTPVPTLALPTPASVHAAEVTRPPLPPPPDASEILRLIASYPWDYGEAVETARCESGLNPNARNPSGATGLFQIIGDNPAMFDPATNVAAAFAKWEDGVRRGNRWYHWNRFGGCGHFY